MSAKTDVYRDAFLKFMADGMSYAEAYEQFDEQELQAAHMAEIDAGEAREDDSLFNLCVKANFERRNKQDFEEQAVPLMLAGWTMELPESHRHNSKDFWRQGQVMSLYWRAPSKRPGKPGRKYLSTNQAFNAMNRQPTTLPAETMAQEPDL